MSEGVAELRQMFPLRQVVHLIHECSHGIASGVSTASCVSANECSLGIASGVSPDATPRLHAFTTSIDSFIHCTCLTAKLFNFSFSTAVEITNQINYILEGIKRH